MGGHGGTTLAVMTPPIVLLHGLATSSARTWGETGWLDLLADAGRAVTAIDLPGHGTAAKPHDTEAFADVWPGQGCSHRSDPSTGA